MNSKRASPTANTACPSHDPSASLVETRVPLWPRISRNGILSEKPWYHEGLNFTCSGCGDCCTGAPGYVWVNQEEINKLAEAVGIEDVDEFEKLYVRKVGIRRSLKEFPNGDCLLFDTDTRKCSVYEARPRQCRTWPFWDSNLRTPEDWKETCRVCKGSGEGKLHSLVEIETQRRVMKI